MNKVFISLAFLFFGTINVFSQDVIIKNNGDKIKCKIQYEDSINVYLKLFKYNQEIETYLGKSQIRSINYHDHSEDSLTVMPFSKALGIGMEYGGIGFNLMINPHKNIGVFGGFGYALAGLGLNAGVKISMAPTSKFNPYLIGMYGYNAAIAIKGASNYNKLFYGSTIGFGMDFKSKKRNSYWTLALLIPFRDSKVKDYINDLEDNHNIEFKNDLSPITISIGYRF